MAGVEKIVEKIPFFGGLSLHQVRQILHTGQMAAHAQSEILCRDGDKSTSLFILMAGELAVRSEDTELARLEPVEIVGEMGVITDQPRCATIEVTEDATLMVIRKIDLERVLKHDPEMASKIYKNMLDSLCRRLRENNAHLIHSKSHTGRRIAASSV